MNKNLLTLKVCKNVIKKKNVVSITLKRINDIVKWDEV